MGKSKVKKGAAAVGKPAVTRPSHVAAKPAPKLVQAAKPLATIPTPAKPAAVHTEPLGAPTGAPAAPVAGLPPTVGNLPVRTTAEPIVVHTQVLGAPVNPFYGPFTGFLKSGKPVRCYLNNQEVQETNGVTLARVYADDKETRLGWGRMVGGMVHIYEDVVG